jgi:hypothetical protein
MYYRRVLVAFSLFLLPLEGAGQELSAETISRIMGVAATTTADGVIRVGWPRTDVEFQVDGLAFRPAMGLGTWAAFQITPAGVRVMGDTVVFEDEVNPALDAAFSSGIEVTALHNHFLFDKPKAYFMHIGGTGSPEALAAGVRSIWDAVKRVRAVSPTPAQLFPGETPRYGELDTEEIQRTIGASGKLRDGVFKISMGRSATMGGSAFGASMGLTTWMAFSGSDELAAVAGDFAMSAEEVQLVLRALRSAGINIVALHNHMLGESPAIFFAHFWGKGPASELARGLRSALDAQRGAAKAGTSAASELTLDFDRMQASAAPLGFTQARTGRGGSGAWEVREDDTAPSGNNVLAQTTSDPTNYRFPLCIYDAFEARDVDLSVSFKPLSGRVDQAAGLVWRYQDADNYYVVRANALEDNVVLYKVENGRRSDLKPKGSWLAYGKDVPVPLGAWSSLRVRVRSNTFSVWLNGDPVFDVEDDTFTEAGKVGLWTKADSVTLFDTLTARSL